MQSDLKPCPFCGSKAALEGTQDTCWVSCENEECPAAWNVRDAGDEVGAVADWNRRALPPEVGAWVACADQMPEQNTDVLAHRQGRINIGRWMQRDDGKSWTWAGTTVHETLARSIPKISCEFTHWMPLPSRPLPQKDSS